MKVDALFQDCGRLENHTTARRNGCRLPGLGIAAHALRFLANDERPEGRELDRFAALKAAHNFLEYELDNGRSLRAREHGRPVNRIIQMLARNGFSCHRHVSLCKTEKPVDVGLHPFTLVSGPFCRPIANLKC